LRGASERARAEDDGARRRLFSFDARNQNQDERARETNNPDLITFLLPSLLFNLS
jgi:hypothetical protein